MDFWESFRYKEFILYQILEKHYNVIISDKPDYIIYSSFGDEILSEPENDAIKIFYTGENEVPNFNICDYGLGYDYLSLGDRYFRLPDYYNSDDYRTKTELMEKKHLGISGFDSLGKTDFCSFVVSNATVKEREVFFSKLSDYKRVDSGGRYLNNIGGPVDDKITFESTHKFSICFENGSYPGYTTEKLVEAFAAQTIPIYWGDPEVCRVFNPKAFVYISDFRDVEAVIQRIKDIDNDDELYLSMLKEPALISQNNNYENTCKRLELWLCHIIEQPKEKARRTSNNSWHNVYYWHRREMKDAFEKPIRFYLSKYCSLFRLIRRLVGR